ncbi:hypothetical protein EfmGK961_10450 [Enterococcus faecium]|nr:hypothetical protein EfmGK961_10450 [Enterococcus faecium]
MLELVWDYQYFGDERTVDAHIKKLRQKIEKVGPQVIQTVWYNNKRIKLKLNGLSPVEYRKQSIK